MRPRTAAERTAGCFAVSSLYLSTTRMSSSISGMTELMSGTREPCISTDTSWKDYNLRVSESTRGRACCTYTKKRRELLKNPPFFAPEFEWSCIISCSNTLFAADVLDNRPYINRARDHSRLGVPTCVDRFDHTHWFDISSIAQCFHLFNEARRVANFVRELG